MTIDWDDAYANAPHIAGAADFPPRWATRAAAFRAAHPPQTLRYGPHARQQLDLFWPSTRPPVGLAVFVHGGYWRAFDRGDWSHLAAGALARGWVVALPGYVLAPEARLSAITAMIRTAIGVAAKQVPGPILLAGHSAGGHLVTRMLTQPPRWTARLRHVLSISGLHDLRPLLHTQMNNTLQLTLAEARRESVALQEPRVAVPVTAWVGGDERPRFIQQSQLLYQIWSGLGADVRLHVEAGRHHFDVIDDLANPDSAMVSRWLSPIP